MANLLLHVGYPKTGSSWLQRHLFANPEYGYGILFGSDAAMRGKTMSNIILPNALLFDASSGKRLFDPEITQVRENGYVPVLSHERLSGTPHSGGYDSEALARRLKALFGGAKVLIVVREQKSMILSSYRQYIRNGGICSLWGYLFPPNRDGRIPLFSFSFFEYDRLVSLYHELFGASNVLVLPHEMLKEQPGIFVSSLNQFAGLGNAPVDPDLFAAGENVGFSAPILAIKRRLNRVVSRRDSEHPGVLFPVNRTQELRIEKGLHWLERAIPESQIEGREENWRLEIANAVADRYRASNRLLTDLIGFDVEAYGYEI